MKIAICYYGLVGGSKFKYGKGEPLNPKIAYDYHKDNLFDKDHQIDIFIHSQSFDQKDNLINLYNPKRFKIEKQKNFFLKALFHKKIILNILSLPIFVFKGKKFSEVYESLKKNFLRCKNCWSRWYSTEQVVTLKKNYEKQKNFRYDLVMLTRLDVGFFSKFEFNNINKNKLTVSFHNDVPAPRNNYSQKIVKNNRTIERGILDFWFISSSDNIDKFSNLYNCFNNYNISPHVSSYEHSKHNNLELDFYKYRGIDHEVVRRISLSDE